MKKKSGSPSAPVEAALFAQLATALPSRELPGATARPHASAHHAIDRGQLPPATTTVRRLAANGLHCRRSSKSKCCESTHAPEIRPCWFGPSPADRYRVISIGTTKSSSCSKASAASAIFTCVPVMPPLRRPAPGMTRSPPIRAYWCYAVASTRRPHTRDAVNDPNVRPFVSRRLRNRAKLAAAVFEQLARALTPAAISSTRRKHMRRSVRASASRRPPSGA